MNSETLNLFGLMFTFTFPGALVGVFAGYALREYMYKLAKRRRSAKKNTACASRSSKPC